MKDKLNVEDCKKILIEAGKIMNDHKDQLCQLDGALGDGDLGLTMSKGFAAIEEQLPKLVTDDVGTLFMESGMTMAEQASSTMGTLFASALMRAGKATKGRDSIDTSGFLALVGGMIEGIVQRGKAKPGDKTILDALVPARTAIEDVNSTGGTLAEAIQQAADAAQAGMEKTKDMQAQHGRAARYLERSVGLQDPGATAGALFLRAFANELGK